MKSSRPSRERGVALLALLAVIMLGASWFVVSRLNAESNLLTAANRNRNAEVLNKAKQALIGYVAAQAAKAGEDNPGAFPCPEAPGSFNATNGTDGRAQTPSCSLPVVGRFPWRTIGTDQLVDASGEPFWYVVSPGWAKPGAMTNTLINSNSTGQLTVDGVANAAVALIIAPGPAFSVPAATGCTAWNQVRSPVAPPDWRNYLECENATSPANAIFVTTGPSGSFNDQVVKITVADVMPAIEAAIAHRIEREIAPVLRSVYEAPNWGLTGTDKVLPFAVPFADPDTLSFTGGSGTTQGLLPLVYTQANPGYAPLCTAGPSAPRCAPTLHGWGSNWATTTPSMSSTGAGVTLLPTTCAYFGQRNWAYCNGTYRGTPTQLTLSGRQIGATALRVAKSPLPTGWAFWFDLTSFTFTWSQPTTTLSINADGSLAVNISIVPPAPLGVNGVMYWLYTWWDVANDHPLVDSRSSLCAPNPPGTCPATSWFTRNEWHKLTYYAIAPGFAASGAAPRSCTTGGTCLSVANLTPAGAQRAILVLAGRSINGSVRPSSTLSNYLEFGNATGAYERQVVSTWIDSGLKKPFNDRIAVIESNP